MCVAPSLHTPTAMLTQCLAPGIKATVTRHASCGCWGCQKLYNDVHDHSRLQNAKHCRRLRPIAPDSSHRACRLQRTSEALIGTSDRLAALGHKPRL